MRLALREAVQVKTSIDRFLAARDAALGAAAERCRLRRRRIYSRDSRRGGGSFGAFGRRLGFPRNSSVGRRLGVFFGFEPRLNLAA
jgi:hypothetical protein